MMQVPAQVRGNPSKPNRRLQHVHRTPRATRWSNKERSAFLLLIERRIDRVDSRESSDVRDGVRTFFR